MALIRLIEGPVGAGKSTFALKLSKMYQAPPLILDEWMATLFAQDRPETGVMEWYRSRKERCLEQIWKVALNILHTDLDVVLELGLIQQSDRERFFDQVDEFGQSMKIYILEASRELRRERVQNRNEKRGETFSMVVAEQVFEMASDLWEPIHETDCRHYDVEFISTQELPVASMKGR